MDSVSSTALSSPPRRSSSFNPGFGSVVMDLRPADTNYRFSHTSRVTLVTVLVCCKLKELLIPMSMHVLVKTLDQLEG